MTYSIKVVASLSYIFISMLIIVPIIIFSNIILNKEFKEYAINEQIRKKEEIIQLVTNSYNTSRENWRRVSLDNIGTHGLEYGLIVRVKDVNNEYLWDAFDDNNEEDVEKIISVQEDIQKRYKDFKVSYEENEYEIKHEDKVIATLYIGAYGPFYLSENDLNFITNLNILIAFVTVVSIAMALVLGISMAKRVSTPILQVVNVTKEIEKGNYHSNVTPKKIMSKEMKEMFVTINNLAKVLEDQEDIRNRLTSDIAHELRTPLAVIQSHLEAIIDGVWKPTKEILESCNNELIRITKIVGDLEKLAQIENDNINLNKVNFKVDDLIDEVLKIFKFEFESRKVNLITKYAASNLFADKDKIKQVIVNIVSNALKYNNGNGCIEISTNVNNDKTIIRFKDTGVGISEEDLPYIFNRFYRVDQSRSRATGGSGIGLAITKAIIEAHDGKIEVFSTLGKGSEFIITI